MSKLGIYLVRGERAADDVFYYTTTTPDWYMRVPAATVFRPCMVHRPEEDRAEWVPVGPYNSNDYDVVITTETMANHTRRIIDSMQVEVERAKRGTQVVVDELGNITRQRNTSADGEVAKGQLLLKQADRLSRIRAILEED